MEIRKVCFYLTAMNSILEEVIQQQVGKVRVFVKGFLDVSKENTRTNKPVQPNTYKEYLHSEKS
jgi:hypothetical protein